MSENSMWKSLVLQHLNRMDIPTEYHIYGFISRNMRTKAYTTRLFHVSGTEGRTRSSWRTWNTITAKHVEEIRCVLYMDVMCDIKNTKKLVIKQWIWILIHFPKTSLVRLLLGISWSSSERRASTPSCSDDCRKRPSIEVETLNFTAVLGWKNNLRRWRTGQWKMLERVGMDIDEAIKKRTSSLLKDICASSY